MTIAKFTVKKPKLNLEKSIGEKYKESKAMPTRIPSQNLGKKATKNTKKTRVKAGGANAALASKNKKEAILVYIIFHFLPKKYISTPVYSRAI